MRNHQIGITKVKLTKVPTYSNKLSMGHKCQAGQDKSVMSKIGEIENNCEDVDHMEVSLKKMNSTIQLKPLKLTQKHTPRF